jgi:hypothetical protein
VTELWPWATIALLGAFHGVNPAMGWLFAVALALQEDDRRAVLRSLVPVGLGHGLAVGLVAAAFGAAGAAVGPHRVRIAAAAVLAGFGAFRLARGFRHKARVGMRVGFRDLTLWSFVVSTGHGAGLMLLPVLAPLGVLGRDTPHAHGASAPPVAGLSAEMLAAVVVHTAAMLGVAAVVAFVVLDRIGLGVLRTAWVNVDVGWAIALLVSGVAMLAL